MLIFAEVPIVVNLLCELPLRGRISLETRTLNPFYRINETGLIYLGSLTPYQRVAWRLGCEGIRVPNEVLVFDCKMLPICTNYNFQGLHRRANAHFIVCLRNESSSVRLGYHKPLESS